MGLYRWLVQPGGLNFPLRHQQPAVHRDPLPPGHPVLRALGEEHREEQVVEEKEEYQDMAAIRPEEATKEEKKRRERVPRLRRMKKQ